jgi:hypothetical protein
MTHESGRHAASQRFGLRTFTDLQAQCASMKASTSATTGESARCADEPVVALHVDAIVVRAQCIGETIAVAWIDHFVGGAGGKQHRRFVAGDAVDRQGAAAIGGGKDVVHVRFGRNRRVRSGETDHADERLFG